MTFLTPKSLEMRIHSSFQATLAEIGRLDILVLAYLRVVYRR